jgi:hypothetical protein
MEKWRQECRASLAQFNQARFQQQVKTLRDDIREGSWQLSQMSSIVNVILYALEFESGVIVTSIFGGYALGAYLFAEELVAINNLPGNIDLAVSRPCR